MNNKVNLGKVPYQKKKKKKKKHGFKIQARNTKASRKTEL
jgi:hypothetical protein